MHFHEMLYIVMMFLASIPLVILVADWVYMLQRNCKHYINDAPRAWNDTDYRFYDKITSKLNENIYAPYSIISFIILFCNVIDTLASDKSSVVWYAQHLESHNTLLCGWGFLNVWIPLVYVICVVSFVALRVILIHMRMIKRLEKGLPVDGIESKITSANALAASYIQALGNTSNIIDIDACITRLRVSVHNISIIDQDQMKVLGAAGVVVIGNNIQVIIGTKSDSIARDMRLLMP